MSNSARTDTPGGGPLSTVARAIAAAPDAVTCASFLLLWIAPTALGPDAVRGALLLMVVEFLLIHATAMLGGTLEARRGDGRSPIPALLLFGALYLGMVGAFALAFGQWWPLAAMGWLLLGKLRTLFGADGGEAARQQRKDDWALSMMAYLGGVVATSLLPLPRLGLQPEVVATLGLPGSGQWIESPQTGIAFGALYFGFLAWAKWRGLRLPRANAAKPEGRD